MQTSTFNARYKLMRAEREHQLVRYIVTDFRGDRFSSVLENQMQIWSTNFGV